METTLLFKTTLILTFELSIAFGLCIYFLKAAKKASRGLRRDFNELENLQVKTKGPANFVTASDIRTQKIIY